MDLHLNTTFGRAVLRTVRSGPDLQLTLEDGTQLDTRVDPVAPDCVMVELDGRLHRVHFWRERSVLHLQVQGRSLRVELEDPDEMAAAGTGDLSPILRAPMPGRILEVLTAVGQTVAAGQALVRMEAMKMEIDVTAPVAGVVAAVQVQAGDLVDPDAELVRIEADADRPAVED